MTEELETGFTAEELGIVPDPEDIQTPVQSDGSINAVSDEMRKAILMDAIQSGEMMPSAWAETPQQPAYTPHTAPQADDGDDESLVFQGDFKKALAAEREKIKAEMAAQFAPAIASMQASTVAQEVGEIMPEAAPIARKLVEQMGAAALNMTPEIKKLVTDAAIGAAVREARTRTIPTHESSTSDAPRYNLAPGIEPADVEFYRNSFEYSYKRQPTTKELKAAGYLR